MIPHWAGRRRSRGFDQDGNLGPLFRSATCCCPVLRRSGRRGAELPVHEFTCGGNGAYTASEYDDYEFNSWHRHSFSQMAGNQAPRQPKWSGNSSLIWDTNVFGHRPMRGDVLIRAKRLPTSLTWRQWRLLAAQPARRHRTGDGHRGAVYYQLDRREGVADRCPLDGLEQPTVPLTRNRWLRLRSIDVSSDCASTIASDTAPVSTGAVFSGARASRSRSASRLVPDRERDIGG